MSEGPENNAIECEKVMFDRFLRPLPHCCCGAYETTVQSARRKIKNTTRQSRSAVTLRERTMSRVKTPDEIQRAGRWSFGDAAGDLERRLPRLPRRAGAGWIIKLVKAIDRVPGLPGRGSAMGSAPRCGEPSRWGRPNYLTCVNGGGPPRPHRPPRAHRKPMRHVRCGGAPRRTRTSGPSRRATSRSPTGRGRSARPGRRTAPQRHATGAAR